MRYTVYVPDIYDFLPFRARETTFCVPVYYPADSPSERGLLYM